MHLGKSLLLSSVTVYNTSYSLFYQNYLAKIVGIKKIIMFVVFWTWIFSASINSQLISKTNYNKIKSIKSKMESLHNIIFSKMYENIINDCVAQQCWLSAMLKQISPDTNKIVLQNCCFDYRNLVSALQ